MPDQLTQLDALLRRGCPAYYARLRPGASDAALAAAEAELGVTLPAAFKAFYRWHDGQEANCYMPWLENLTLLPLDAAVRANRTLTKLLQADELTGSNWWDSRWLPFL